MIQISFSIYTEDPRFKLGTISVVADQVRYSEIIKKMLDAGLITVKNPVVKSIVSLGSGLAKESLIYNVLAKNHLFRKRPWIETLIGSNLEPAINQLSVAYQVPSVTIEDIKMEKI